MKVAERVAGDEVAQGLIDVDHQHTTPARAAPGIARSGTCALDKMRVVHAR